jgi:hypothetical protein
LQYEIGDREQRGSDDTYHSQRRRPTRPRARRNAVHSGFNPLGQLAYVAGEVAYLHWESQHRLNPSVLPVGSMLQLVDTTSPIQDRRYLSFPTVLPGLDCVNPPIMIADLLPLSTTVICMVIGHHIAITFNEWRNAIGD